MDKVDVPFRLGLADRLKVLDSQHHTPPITAPHFINLFITLEDDLA